MKTKLQSEIFKKYSEFFSTRNRTKLEGDIIMPIDFGIECEDGWYWLLDNLFEIIKNYIDNNEHLEISKVDIIQIKEKYGSLRVYFNGGDDRIDGMVEFAEKLSYGTCEFCGSNKEVGHTDGWIYTICKECYDKSTEARIKDLAWKQAD